MTTLRVLQVISGMMYGGGQRVAEDLLDEADAQAGIEMDLCLLGDRAIDRFQRRGEVVPYDGRYNRIGVLARAGMRLRRIVARDEPHVVHTHGWDADIIGAIAVKGTPVVHIPHQHLALPLRTGMSGAVRKVLTRRAFSRRRTHVVAVSNAVADFVAKAYPWDRASIRVILNGIDTARYARRGERDAGSTMTIGCAARLTPMKGIGHLIGAMRLLGNSADIKLRIAGTGEDEAKLRKQAEGLESRVRFEGHVADMPAFYSQIDVLVLPSISLEGLPLTLLEAMATGLPVISSDAGGAREAFVDGEHGILVPPGDERALAAAIAELAADPFRRLEMGRRAYGHVHAGFSRRRFADDVFALYRETAGASGR